MLSNPFRRSAPIAPDVRIRPLYMNPPVNEMPYSSPNSDKDTKLASAEMKSKLSAAYEMAKAVKPQYDKINSRFDIRNPPPNPFIRGIYFLAPNVRPDEELQRLFTKDLYKKEEKKLTDITNAYYGLLAAEARGIPRDVILNNISPYIQPSKRQYDKSPDTIFDDTVKQYISYPTHVPSINSNMSPFAPAGSIPNLGFS